MVEKSVTERIPRRLAVGMAACLLAVGGVMASAPPAEAAMPHCDVSVYTPLDTGSGVWFRSGVVCGSSYPEATYARAGLERSTGTIYYYAPVSTSSGTTSLNSQRTVTPCSTSGSYRTVGWGHDKFTNVEETRSAYSSITC